VSRQSKPTKILSDLKRVDAHVIQPKEYEDAPELTDEQLARSKAHIGGIPVRTKTRKYLRVYANRRKGKKATVTLGQK
jgi:hypothetical protein